MTEELLDSVRALPPRQRTGATVALIAFAVIARGERSTADALAHAGFTLAEMIEHGPEAMRIASEIYRDFGAEVETLLAPPTIDCSHQDLMVDP